MALAVTPVAALCDMRMAMAASVLLVGESWVVHEIHYKGFDTLNMTSFESGGSPLVEALTAHGHEVTWMRADEATRSFPFYASELDGYDVVILSDVGANSLLLPPEVWREAKVRPNRLEALRQWTEAGGGLLMCGGWRSFAGFQGGGFYHGTAVERALPVEVLPYDDRVETPEGAHGAVLDPEHPAVRGLPASWPPVLGHHRLTPSAGSTVLVETEQGLPLLVVGEYGAGRSAAWASDIAPHWCPPEFSEWDGYGRLFAQLVDWLAAKDGSGAAATDRSAAADR